MTLYELTGQYLELLNMAEDVDAETLADTLEAIGGEIEDKADNYAKVIRTLEGDVQSVKSEIDRLTAKKQTMENNVRKIKESLQASMMATGKTKFKTQLFSFGIQKNPASVQLKEGAEVPSQFYKQPEPVLDKTALKNYLKENGAQDYAELVQTESLRIK